MRRAAQVRRYRQVAAETGVNYHWLCKFATGRLPNPAYETVKILHDYYRALELGLPTNATARAA